MASAWGSSTVGFLLPQLLPFSSPNVALSLLFSHLLEILKLTITRVAECLFSTHRGTDLIPSATETKCGAFF